MKKSIFRFRVYLSSFALLINEEIVKGMDQDLLHRFLGGKVTPAEKTEIKQWISESEEHTSRLFKERMIFDAMIISGEIPNDRIVPVRRKRLSYLFVEFSKIAAVAAIMFVVGAYFYSRKMEEIYLATNTISVPVGQRANIQLPDGTNVWLNARSHMTYPAYFTGEKREIELDGEAYFEVTHDVEKPFIVHTDGFDIKVLGTKFNVKAYKDSEDFTTALMEGAVEVTNKNNTDNSIRLLPDQKVDYQNGRLLCSSIENYDVYRWREGLLCFKNVRFSDLMKQFENSYGVNIIIGKEKVKEKIFSGKLRISDGVDNALRILQKDGGYIFEWDESGTTIYIK